MVLWGHTKPIAAISSHPTGEMPHTVTAACAPHYLTLYRRLLRDCGWRQGGGQVAPLQAAVEGDRALGRPLLLPPSGSVDNSG